MQIVIICGGFATRLGNLAKKIPKSMMEINGKPFLLHQIEKLKKQDIKDIVLCVGHFSNQIEEYFGNGEKFGVNIKYSYDGEKQLGPIGAVKNAESLLDNDFIIMYGDSYLSVDFQKAYSDFKKTNKPALMVVYKNQNKYDKSNLIVSNNMVIGYKEKDNTEEMKFIDYGTSILSKKTLDSVPENAMYSTGEFFSELIKKNQLCAYEAKKRFYHIGNPEALEELRKCIKNQ